MIATFFLLFMTLVSASPCTRNPLCESLEDQSFACSETLGEKECAEFVATFEKLLVPENCKDPGHEFRFALGTCSLKAGAPSTELHVSLLARLPFLPALKLFTSEKFRKTLDGHTAEVYLKWSRDDEKKLGHSLKPGVVRPECRRFDQLEFKDVKGDIRAKGKVIAKNYDYQSATVGDYDVWAGDVPHRIVERKSGKTCEVKLGLVNDIRKVPGQDIVKYETRNSGGQNVATFVDLKSCQKIWEGPAETDAEGIHVSVDRMSKSAWKACADCWSRERAGCLRVP